MTTRTYLDSETEPIAPNLLRTTDLIAMRLQRDGWTAYPITFLRADTTSTWIEFGDPSTAFGHFFNQPNHMPVRIVRRDLRSNA